MGMMCLVAKRGKAKIFIVKEYILYYYGIFVMIYVICNFINEFILSYEVKGKQTRNHNKNV